MFFRIYIYYISLIKFLLSVYYYVRHIVRETVTERDQEKVEQKESLRDTETETDLVKRDRQILRERQIHKDTERI